MALTVRRRKSGLIVPKTPKLLIPSMPSMPVISIEEEIIEAEIKKIVEKTVFVKSRKDIKKIMFVPIYKRVRGEKEISKIYLKVKNTNVEKVLDIDDIESTGVALLEFFDYIITNGAIELQDPKKALEIM
mgnify:FL=1